MFIHLDLVSRQPIYLQIVEKIKELIVNETLQPHEKLPSVRKLALDITINPNTIQKAYRELESQGYVYSISGRGIFVAEFSEIQSTEKIEKLKKELRKNISEVMFLGVSKEQLIELIAEVEKEEK